MKKILGGICVLCIMGMGLPTTYADEMVAEAMVDEKMMYDDSSYYYPVTNFNLEYIESQLNGRNGIEIIKANWDMISGNTVSEDYEYNSTHYYSKKMMMDMYMPEGLSRYIKSARMTFSQDTYVPIMYDSMGKETVGETQERKEALSMDLDLTQLDAGVDIDIATLRKTITENYGASFTVQVELEMSNGSTILFSNPGYLYLPADNAEGKMTHLSAYYYTLNPGYGYPDMDGLLKVAFMKLRTSSKDTASYVASLKKVVLKIDAYTEKYMKEQASMVEGISTEEDFSKIVEKYGKMTARSSFLNDIKYKVESEMLNDDAQELINELFTEK